MLKTRNASRLQNRRRRVKAVSRIDAAASALRKESLAMHRAARFVWADGAFTCVAAR
jgi:hypothetical protein